MTTCERCWAAWLLAVGVVALVTPGAGMPGHRPELLGAVLGAIAVLQAIVVLAARRWPAGRMRVLRGALAVVCTPLAFSALGWLLPAVAPEPWEYTWWRLDRALFGMPLTAALQRLLLPFASDGLQAVYAAFYVLPVGAALVVARRRGGAAFDRALVILVGSFLASYLGYLLFPTLGPGWIVDHGPDVPWGWFGGRLHQAIDDAEANRWDCFPSGHTMLSVVSLILVRRWAPTLLPWFLAVALPLVAATLLLRYHWPADVVAGAAAAWPSVRLFDWLLTRDGAAPA